MSTETEFYSKYTYGINDWKLIVDTMQIHSIGFPCILKIIYPSPVYSIWNLKAVSNNIHYYYNC